MKQEIDVSVKFDFDTGALILVFPDKTEYEYCTDEGKRLAQRVDRFVDKAFKQWVKNQREKQRLKTMN